MMGLSDDELRGLVRNAIARARSGRHDGQPAAPAADLAVAAPVTIHVHASHLRLPLGPGGDADGNCVIEPAVRCTHCGFCQSFGH